MTVFGRTGGCRPGRHSWSALVPTLILLAGLTAAVAPPSHPAGATTVSVRYGLSYGSRDVERADVYTPAGATTALPAVLVVHGGGWHEGSKGGWGPQARQIAGAGFVVVAVDYQLATADRPGFPVQLHELKTAVTWIRSDAAALGVDPARLGALGSSAGGNLVAMLATDATGPLQTGDRIAAAVTWSAILDLNSPGLSGDKADYVGCHTDCTTVLSDASPIHHVSTGDTPMELFNSEHELVRRSDVDAMDARLTRSHVVHRVVIYPGSEHGTTYRDRAMPDTIAFLQQQLG